MTKKTSFFFKEREVSAIIFDLDGTLYSQKKMHMYMFYKIFLYYFLKPKDIWELRVLYYFRKKRYEVKDCKNIEKLQYENISDFLNISESEVRRIINYWMHESPLDCIKKCKYEYIEELFKKIKIMNIKIAVVSDYPVKEKLEALGLKADVLVCSTDEDVDAFKPNPNGFIMASKKLSIPKEKCVVIGDREDKDGEASRRANMFFLKADKNNGLIFE